ncbi:MAG: hypothetical protein HZA53_18600 [Planctomycetes bacterium]|nr:hypothetical protein [Planctomycetota bacterium]
MIACLLASALAFQAGDDLERVLSIVDPPDALRAATGLVEPGSRSRAEVEVRYRAGDLFGARRAALAALARGTEDAVLALRATERCTTLRDPAGARTGLRSLVGTLAKAPPAVEQHAAWAGLVARREEELARLDATVEASAVASKRARWCSLLFLASAAGLALLLLRARRSPPAPV